LGKEIWKLLAGKSVFVVPLFQGKNKREKGGFPGLDKPSLCLVAGQKKSWEKLWHGLVTRAPLNTEEGSSSSFSGLLSASCLGNAQYGRKRVLHTFLYL